MKKLTWCVLAAALAVTGCGDSSSSGESSNGANSGGNTGGNTATPVTVTGVAEAPGGSVALFQPFNPAQYAFNLLVPRAEAAITGLEPITGATVELIRIDDSGMQVGDVLASATTSTTGDFSLDLPEGVSLSGDLVLRITGTGGATLDAQAVEESVDINPISDYVLQSLIDAGVALDGASVADTVIKLKGKIEEYDLAAGADLEEMEAILEAETSDYVDAEIELEVSDGGDASVIAGDFRAFGMTFGIHDTDSIEVGTWALSNWNLDLSFVAGNEGEVTVNYGAETGNDAMLTTGGPTGAWELMFSHYVDSETGDFDARYTADGVLAFESEFEENVDGDYAWRFPTHLEQLQTVSGNNMLVGISHFAGVRYQTTDTDGDGVNDALDPQAREGDEVFRSLTILMKAPSGVTLSDISGDYGRIYYSGSMNASGVMELEAERNTLSFDGAGNLDIGGGINSLLSRDGQGVPSFTQSDIAGDTGIPITVTGTGQVDSIGGSPAEGYFNEDLSALIFNESSGTNGSDARMDITLAVKLPTSLLDLQGRSYRVFSLSNAFDGASMGLDATRFSSLLTVTDATTGSFSGTTSSLWVDVLGANIVAETGTETDQPVAISLAADGSISLTVSDTAGETLISGYMNHDGSVGVLQSQFTPAMENQPTQMGLVMLVQVSAP